ncbi:MAG: hypothetical protein QCH31_11810 [Methanolobus sp.]|nr:hypothetical protein [Methanolobus sp.]
MTTNKNKVYSQMLDEIFSNYNGKHHSILRYIPLFFDLLQRIYLNDELTWETKFKINACFSYFAIPKDIIADSDDGESFIDDLFICAHVLYELAMDHPQLVQESWEYEENIIEVIEEVMDRTEEILGGQSSTVLGMTGLLKFNTLCSIFNMLKERVDTQDKIDMIECEIQELEILLKNILIISGTNKRYRTFNDIKNSFTEEEWDLVQSIIEKVKEHRTKFDNGHELELDRLRHEIIIGLDESVFYG